MTPPPTPDVQLVAHPSATPLQGTAPVPGDKSISHRALLLGALAAGRSTIAGLLESEDVMATLRAVQALGAGVAQAANGDWHIDGGGLGAIREPAQPLDCGNSGTTARLLTGLLAAHPIAATLTGDASLSARPMGRVFDPMREFGAAITARHGDRLPATIRGTDRPLPVDWTMAVASAQVKSAILLAGLHAPGETRIVEPAPTRDHTERMLRAMGARLESAPLAAGGWEHRLAGDHDLAPLDLTVPGDPSSAALVAAAACAVPGSSVTLTGVGTNPTRFGFFETLREMGAAVELRNARELGGEPVADLVCGGAQLHGVRVPAARAPRMIDEYPALAVVAAFAAGPTEMTGIGELRAKESDRIAAMLHGLRACGVRAEATADSLTVWGDAAPAGDATVAAGGDHRIAMAFLALGLGAQHPVTVSGAHSIATSFPNYAALMRGLGAELTHGAAP